MDGSRYVRRLPPTTRKKATFLTSKKGGQPGRSKIAKSKSKVIHWFIRFVFIKHSKNMEMICALENLTDEEMRDLFTSGTLNLSADDEENLARVYTYPPDFGSETVDAKILINNGMIKVKFRSLIDVEDDEEVSELFHDDFYTVIDDVAAWIKDKMENYDDHGSDDNDSDDNDSDDNDSGLPGELPTWAVPSLAPRSCETIMRRTGEPCGKPVSCNYHSHCGKNMHFPGGTDGNLRCPAVVATGEVCGKLAGDGPQYQLSGHCGKYTGHHPPVIASVFSDSMRAIILVGHSHFVQATVLPLHGPPPRTVIQYANVGNSISRNDVSVFLHEMNSSQHIILHAGSCTNPAKIMQDTYFDHAVCGDNDSSLVPHCGVYLWDRGNPPVNQVSQVYWLQNANDSVSISQAFAAHPKYHCLIFLGCRNVTDQSLCGLMKNVTIHDKKI